MTLTARKTIPAPVLAYTIQFHTHKSPFRWIPTLQVHKLTPCQPRGLCLPSKPHCQPPQENSGHVNLAGLFGSRGLGGKLREICPTVEPPSLPRMQTLSC